VLAPAPYDNIPIYFKAGSVTPYSPGLDEYISLIVCKGASGKFTLYEDDGLTYKYEKGECSAIPISWNDATKTLTIGARVGSFPGIEKTRSFMVEEVGKASVKGIKQIEYTGKAVTMKLQ
jgi:alpha-D-xyloside xylohydrolase